MTSPDNHGSPPTIVLVHGAWADASSWSRVVSTLQDEGYKVRAIANPLRSLSGDAASVRAFLDSLTGPIVLVGHSYGGAVVRQRGHRKSQHQGTRVRRRLRTRHR